MPRKTVAGLTMVLGVVGIFGGAALPSQGAQTPSAARVSDEASAAPPPPPDATMRTSGHSWSLPFILQDNLIRVDAVIDGHVRSAVLDSGTGTLLLSEEAARDLNLNGKATDIVASGAGGAVQKVRSVELDSLELGAFTFRKTSVYVADLSHLSRSAGFPIDLLLGTPVFSQGSVTVDYATRRLIFGPSGAVPCSSPIPLTVIHGVPVVDVLLQTTRAAAPVRLKMMVDLGTRHAKMMIGGRFLRTTEGKSLLGSGRAAQVGTGIGGRVDGVVATVLDLRIGQLDLGRQNISLTNGVPTASDALFDGTLGVPLWIGGTITFDYPAHRVCMALPS